MKQRRPEGVKALSTDPLLLRMLTTHTHCGEPMTTSRQGPLGESHTSPVHDVVITYSCACGFRFDQPINSQHHDKDLP